MRFVALAAVLLYVASGLYLVRGDETAVVRRFGRHAGPPRQGGLHYDWPWPFARVDRVPRQAVRTLAVGLPAERVRVRDRLGTDREGADALLSGIDRQAEFLTGDKNILNLQLTVQYVVEDPARWLFGATDPDVALRRFAEAEVTALAAECGVDFVQLGGLAEFQRVALARLRAGAARRDWGVSIEDASLGHVSPPVEVKAAFLDVSNARAERDQTVSKETARAESLQALARSQETALLDRARGDQRGRVEMARADAARLAGLWDELHAPVAVRTADTADRSPATRPPSAAEVDARRRRLMRRMFVEFVEETFPRVGRVLFVDPERPTDLVLPPAALPSEPAP